MTSAETASSRADPAAPRTHGHSAPDACSVLWDQARAPALGTASAAGFYVALEQAGPWGREAATQSHLDPDVGQGLDRLCADHGGRLVLIRPPGAHADAHSVAPHRVYVAGGLDDRGSGHSVPWLLTGDLDDPIELARLPWRELADGDLDDVQDAVPDLEESGQPVLMVCTNAKRDVCCAVRGRPVALAVAAERPGQVWECSHTGGHRFAPTGILLPHGQTYARLTPALAASALDAAAAGEMPADALGPAYDRGRSVLTAPAQAAESTVRQRIRELNLTALWTTAAQVGGAADSWDAVTRHRDGRTWRVRVTREPDGDHRPDSCGKAPVPTWRWDCRLR